MNAEKILARAKQTLKQAEENAVSAQTRFEDVAGRQAVGEEISGAALQSARRARDEAAAALEAAAIGLRAAAEKVTQEQAEALAAAEAADWASAEALGDDFHARAGKVAKILEALNAEINAFFDVAERIVVTSPRARQRPDVQDLHAARLRARLQKACELSLPVLYGATAERRYAFKGFVATLTEPLPFFVSKSHER